MYGTGRGVGKRGYDSFSGRGRGRGSPNRGRGRGFRKRRGGAQSRGRGFGNQSDGFRKQQFGNQSSFGNQSTGRVILTSFPISGYCADWNKEKGFGWLKANDPIENFTGQRSGNGKVFIHRNDLVGCDALEKDLQVKFFLYGDDRGLGAQKCQRADNFDASVTIEGAGNGYSEPEPKSVISIYVENLYIGGIIGKKGATIKELQQTSGAKIDIVQDEKSDNKDPLKCRLINLTGTSGELKTVVKALAKHLSTAAQSLHAKIVFLIHQTKAGRLIGKKGANIKKIRGEKNSVFVTISKEPIDVSGQPLITVTCFGPQKDMENAIDETVEQLVNIYKMMLQNFNESQGGQPQGYNQGYSSHTEYGNGYRTTEFQQSSFYQQRAF